MQEINPHNLPCRSNVSTMVDCTPMFLRYPVYITDTLRRIA